MYPGEYNTAMIEIYTLPQFDEWLSDIKDGATRIRLRRRLEKAERGLLGDIGPVGSGVFEMREHFGPGWRMYFAQRGERLIVMLAGGDKSTQAADIAKALRLAERLED